MSKLLSLYGLKFHPFHRDVPIETLYTTPAVGSSIRRVEFGIADGGFAMLAGDPGTGKSLAMRLWAQQLRAMPVAAATGLPPAYLSQHDPNHDGEKDHE
jgi:general secretion pathway protein A